MQLNAKIAGQCSKRKFKDGVLLCWLLRRCTKSNRTSRVCLVLRKKLAVQLDLNEAAPVDSNAPRLLSTARKGSKEVVAVVGHWCGWVVDPVV